MAFGSPVEIASGQVKAAGTSLVLSSAFVAVGDLVTVRAAWDNIDGAEGATNRLSLTDESGNVWTKVGEYTYGVSGAADGATVATWFSVITTQIDVGDDITITNTTSATAKAAVAEKWAIDEAEVALDVLVQDGGASGTFSDPTISGMATGEKLIINTVARESHNTDTFDADADYSDLGTNGTGGGGTASNVNIRGSYRISTVTSDTWSDEGATVIRDHAQLYFSLVEVAGGGTPKELDPTMAGTSTFAATLSTPKQLASTMAGSSTMTTDLVTPARLAIVMAGGAALVATLLVPKRVGAVMAGGGALAVALAVPKRLAALMAGDSDFTASLSVPQGISALMAGGSQLVADLAVPKHLGALMAGGAQFAAGLEVGIVIVYRKMRLLVGFGN